jgi:hypothetical protein
MSHGLSIGSIGGESLKMGEGNVVEGYDFPSNPVPARLEVEKRQSLEGQDATAEDKIWDARRYYGV